MSLQTPARVRRLQRAFYVKAKQEPAYRFYLLYDKVYCDDVLHHAYRVSRATRGARTPGVEGVTFADIEAAGQDEWLAGLQETLRTKTYRPAPVRRVLISKPGDGHRPLGISTIRDRVVQTAAKLVLEPLFEADFDDSAYGYRPKRSATDAVRAVRAAAWRERGKDHQYQARVINYADDFVSLSRGHAAEALAWTRWAMTHLGLTLNETRTYLRTASRDLFDFLGYTFWQDRYRKTGQTYLAAQPLRRSVPRLKRAVRAQLRPGNQGSWSAVRNRLTARYAAGRPTSATAPGRPPVGRSTTTSTAACVAFCGDGIRPRRAGPGVSRPSRGWARSGCTACDRCRSALSRVPRHETSRRAGCGKSARPV